MADLELVRSSQEECEYVHTRLQEYNRPYISRSISRMVDGSLQE